jgi:hypothetical protein
VEYSIIGDAGLTPSKQQTIAIKPVVKKVAASPTNLHGPQKQILRLSSQSNDNMDNIESDISVGTKLNQRSSWSDSIIDEECSNKLRVQDAKIKHPKKKLVFCRELFSSHNTRYSPNSWKYLQRAQGTSLC